MRIARILIAFFVLISTAFAAGLKVRVVDPSEAAVSAAQIVLVSASGRVVASTNAAADGSASLDAPAGEYTARVLAPGFAPSETKVKVPGEQVTFSLKIATATENVVVTATATPVPASETGVASYALNGKQIELLNEPSAGDVLRFTPGAYVSNAGRMGGLATMFVRGGETRYNKVIVDGVPVTVNDAGGNFNFGAVPMEQVGRLELQRGANSTLYGSDAMTSVVQVWSAQGTTKVPVLRFGADGGTFGTGHGYASVSGAVNRFDYNVFGDQFNSEGQGVNDGYSNSMEGANIGIKLTDRISSRTRIRHWNSRTGTPGAWDFSTGTVPEDIDQHTRENNLLASTQLDVAFSNTFQTTFSGFEYRHVRQNVDAVMDRPQQFFDFPYDSRGAFNNAGFETQSEYTPRSWAKTVFGYRFENEIGTVNDQPGDNFGHGLRRNHSIYGEELLNWRRLSLLGGMRWEHNESFGNKGLPRASLSYQLLQGGELLSGTRLKVAYSEGFKAPTFLQTFGECGNSFCTIENPNLKPEQTRSWEGGFVQGFARDRYSLSATYFHNLFRDLIQYVTIDFKPPYPSQYQNLNKSMAHGVELELNGRVAQRLTATTSYTYTATQALVANPCTPAFDTTCTGPGMELIRRPKHFGQALVTYVAPRWGASVTGSFVGRRRDSDYFAAPLPVASVAGYARVDVSAWRTINHYVTAYASINNILNNHYQEVAGYPALRANFRAGLRFRIGGE